MQQTSHNNYGPNARRTIAFYNMVPNVFWSVVNITPVYIFCYRYLSTPLTYFFAAMSILGAILPKNFYNSLQLTKSPRLYRKLGVTFLNKLTQNGSFINRRIRKHIPGYQVISKKITSQKKLLQQTYMFERFHFAMFIFFTLSAVFALIIHRVGWCLVISIANLAYNIYPNLLQQYIRLRLTSFNRTKISAPATQTIS